MLLLRLVPLLPFNMLNYLLSVTPINLGAYILATWLGMMVDYAVLALDQFVLFYFSSPLFLAPYSAIILSNQKGALLHCEANNYRVWFLLQPITFAFVYVGTTLKDLSDVTHGWSEVSTARLVSASFFFFFFYSLSSVHALQ